MQPNDITLQIAICNAAISGLRTSKRQLLSTEMSKSNAAALQSVLAALKKFRADKAMWRAKLEEIPARKATIKSSPRLPRQTAIPCL